MSLVRLLIYENSIHRADWLRGMVESAGYIAKTVFYHAEAEAAVKKERFDLLLAGFDLFPLPSSLEKMKIIILAPEEKYQEQDDLARRYSATCITYPYDERQALAQIKKALEKRKAAPTTETPDILPEIVGDCPAIRKVKETIALAARISGAVLILGETGTGKELVARGLHNLGPKSSGPFVALNCAAMPESLLETELFGHEKGAFTGAVKQRAGKFESASGGTLFLDEIGDMPQSLQVKLLRVLESSSFCRVGGEKEIVVDVKIVCATNRNIFELAENGSFRRDLLYRINVILIELPALRERLADLPLLARHFLKIYAEKYGKNFSGFTSEALKKMEQYRWPGNIRQLQHSIERAIIQNKGAKISTIDFGHARSSAGSAPPEIARLAEMDFARMKDEVMAYYEKLYVSAILKKAGGSMQKASGLSGIDRKTLYRKMKERDIDKKDFK